MYYGDIKTIKCKVSKTLQIEYDSSAGISILEQECHYNIEKNKEGVGQILVCCTHQCYITKLIKSEFFTLEGVTLSNHAKNDGFVLQIKGTLLENGLTLRTKLPAINEELRKQRSETAKRNFSKTPQFNLS